MRGTTFSRPAARVGAAAILAATVLAAAPPALPAATAQAAGGTRAQSVQATAQPSSGQGGVSLEAAAGKAGEIGRKVAMSLIGLGFAIASIVLVFRRDFKEATGVFAVGLVAVLLATPAGVNVLRATVTSLFGG